MAIVNHKIKYERNEVLLSIGYFKKSDIELLYMLAPPKYAEIYDPLPEVYKLYKALSEKYPTLIAHDKAVSDCDKDVELIKRKFNSTILLKDKKKSNVLKIKAVSFTDIVNRLHKKYKVIDKVLINCEGEEINIIKNTSIDIFKKCKYILVSFHDFVEDFNITEEDVKICVEKLSLTHNAKHFEKDCNWWEFTIKNG